LYYFISIDVEVKLLPAFLIFLICICLISIIFQNKSFFQNLQVVLFTVILLFLCLEILKFFPNVLPLSLRNYLITDGTKIVKVVEYLNESPYAKFKPGVVVRSQGYRGSDKQFVYEWKTDRLGFKNPDNILDGKEPIQVVVIGDSFAEGMGVATEDTFSSLLSQQGYLTYNLGVQGYAPKQMEGSFRLYGLNLQPKYVIVAYCSTIYRREPAFFDEQAVIRQRKMTGGISSIDNSEKIEIREKTSHLTTAIFLLVRNLYRSSMNNIRNAENMVKTLKNRFDNNYLLSTYSYEILEVDNEKYNSQEVKQLPEWKSTVQSILNVKKMADQIGAKVIVIILPHRGSMYYTKATGKPLPDNTILAVETSLLKELCKEQNMVFLDPSNRIENYVNKLTDEQKELYPYLELDGHMSKYGHQLLEVEIEDYLNNICKKSNENSLLGYGRPYLPTAAGGPLDVQNNSETR
jgi:hypothetical protein